MRKGSVWLEQKMLLQVVRKSGWKSRWTARQNIGIKMAQSHDIA